MGDHWLLNGSKIFITNGKVADTYLVTAKTERDKGSRGISGFIVEKRTPCFSFGTKEKRMGIKGSALMNLCSKIVKFQKKI